NISSQGVVDQKINVVANAKISLVLRPEHKAESVKGYLIFKSKQDISKNNSTMLGFLKAAISSIPPFGVSEQKEQAENTLVVNEFEYTDPDNDGLYTAEINSPVVEGNYDIMTVVKYVDKKIGDKVMHLMTVVDPEGYVYEKLGKGEMRISGAKVSIYWLNSESKNYELWPAKDFGQENPQITDKTGKYSFLVPEGNYYIEAEADGYNKYKGDAFDLNEGSGVHTNIELKGSGFASRLLDWRVLLALALAIILILIAIIISLRKIITNKK
ncbi:MAG: carboxypeptidase-like regulatory domain-containing protein, partial [Candidatus Nealsonbacteria bacterium]|nr:carboxypeptidase-like regulatory domain-containing protein [Candidatus Nealsonbacteria bacterium]